MSDFIFNSPDFRLAEEFPIDARVEVRGRPDTPWRRGVVIGHTRAGGCIVTVVGREANPGGFGRGHIRYPPAVVRLADLVRG